jgi:hypothetical protein
MTQSGRPLETIRDTAPDRTPPPPPQRRSPRHGPVWPGLLLYGLLALVAYLPVWPGNPRRVPWCPCGDTAQSIWFLRWTPFALTHGHSLYASDWIDFPSGFNLAQNVSMPLLGAVGAPLTWLVGPVSTFTFLLWLAIAGSASSCFVVLLRWVQWKPAAFAGGLVYAFGPYMAAQALGHLNLVFLPIPPILILVLHELIVDQRGSARRWGISLGLLAGAQFLISPEVLIDCILLAAVGVTALAAANRNRVATHVAHAARGGLWALVAFLPLIAWQLVSYFAGPDRYTGSPWHGSAYAEDLLGSVIPSLNQRMTTTGLAAFGDRLQSDLAENGAYLGVPLIVLLIFLVVRYRHDRLMRGAAVMAVTAWLLSLGPRLVVDGHATVLRLPYDVLAHLPVLNSLLAGRFTLFVDLACGFVLAIGLDRLRHELVDGRRVPIRRVGTFLGVLILFALVPLTPRWPYPSTPVSATTPPYFTGSGPFSIPEGSVVLTYPYPTYPTNQAMLWQAVSSMRFKILGGYVLVPGAGGAASNQPTPLVPDTVPQTLIADYAGTPLVGPMATPADVRALVARYGVRTVLLVPSGVNPAAAVALFRGAFGVPTITGGVDVWHLAS